MNGFIVNQPGLLSLIQDRGRFGAHNLGLTTGGPLDSLAFDWANRLLGNDSNASVVEISFGGLSLEAGADTGAADKSGKTPEAFSRNKRILEILREHAQRSWTTASSAAVPEL